MKLSELVEGRNLNIADEVRKHITAMIGPEYEQLSNIDTAFGELNRAMTMEPLTVDQLHPDFEYEEDLTRPKKVGQPKVFTNDHFLITGQKKIFVQDTYSFQLWNVRGIDIVELHLEAHGFNELAFYVAKSDYKKLIHLLLN